MIRGNYSLAKEVRKNELKQRAKLQQRQKNDHQLQKLSKIDPIRLYFQIQKLEASTLEHDQRRLKSLKDDWLFIQKQGLHKEKVNAFLELEKKKQQEKEKAARKLWGRESVYFNAELNPFGKVPDVTKLPYKLEQLPNIKKPTRFVKYERDPIIEELGIQVPEGAPPRYYKKPLNTKMPAKATSVNSEHKSAKSSKTSVKNSVLDSDSDAEVYSEDEYAEWGTKKARRE